MNERQNHHSSTLLPAEQRCYPLAGDGSRITRVPHSAFYIPDFITEEEEAVLLEEIYKVPKPKWTQLSGRRLQNWGSDERHTKKAFHLMTFLSVQCSFQATELNEWIASPKGHGQRAFANVAGKHTKTLDAMDVFSGKIANHVLVNEYTPGQGIMPHLDGPLFHPVISTISLGSGTILEFYEPRKIGDDMEISTQDMNDGLKPFTSIFLARRSLIIIKDEMYTKFLHGISEREVDTLTSAVANLNFHPELSEGSSWTRGTRISLTIRHVPRVLKMRLQLGR